MCGVLIFAGVVALLWLLTGPLGAIMALLALIVLLKIGESW